MQQEKPGSSSQSNTTELSDIPTMLLQPEQIAAKFVRFLQAAKGARLLPENFRRVEFVQCRQDAVQKFNLCDLTKPDSFCGKYWATNNFKDNENSLRTLHVVICGPVMTEDELTNFI